MIINDASDRGIRITLFKEFIMVYICYNMNQLQFGWSQLEWIVKFEVGITELGAGKSVKICLNLISCWGNSKKNTPR